MSVTWHWELGKAGKKVHAKSGLDIEGRSLCGEVNLADEALFRPPFFEIRCKECEALRKGDAEHFPNPYEDLK